MKKSIVVLSSMLLFGVAFEGCQKKGEGDPSISMHGRKARITGDWTLSAGTQTDISGGTSTTTTISGTTATMTSGSTTTVYTLAQTLSIVKDGTFTQKTTMTATGFNDVTTITGTWNWTGGVGDLKKRSQIVMTTLTSNDVQTIGTATTTTIKTYSGSDAPSSINDIFELKNKEIIVKWDGTTVSGSSTSSSKGEMTFVQ